MCYVLGEIQYDRTYSCEIHVPLSPPHPTVSPTSGWPSWQDATLLGWHLCKEGEIMLLLKLVETGKNVDQDAFLISLPRGTRQPGDAGSRDWSGLAPFPFQPLQLAPRLDPESSF